MAGLTNRGKKLILEYCFARTARPANFYVGLCTSADTPDDDTNTFGELTQIAAGNGYTDGGYELTPNATDFDASTEDDSNNYGNIQVKDVVWTAAGGAIPGSGDGARWAVLLDNNATVGNRQVIAYFDLSSDRTVSSGQTLTLQDLEIRITEA